MHTAQPEVGAAPQRAPRVPDARGEDVVQGNMGCSLPWIHIRRVACTTMAFRSIVSGLPGQLRGQRRGGPDTGPAGWGLDGLSCSASPMKGEGLSLTAGQECGKSVLASCTCVTEHFQEDRGEL